MTLEDDLGALDVVHDAVVNQSYRIKMKSLTQSLLPGPLPPPLTSTVDVAIASPSAVLAPVLVVHLEQSPVLGTVPVLVRQCRVHGTLRLDEANPARQVVPGDSVLD